MQRLKRSFKDAFSGLAYCLHTQKNITIHLVMGLVVIGIALALSFSWIEVMFILIAVFSVLISEVFNTAIERAVDVATKEVDPVAHIAKDVAAGAVLLSAIFSVLIGSIIFIRRIFIDFNILEVLRNIN